MGCVLPEFWCDTLSDPTLICCYDLLKTDYTNLDLSWKQVQQQRIVTERTVQGLEILTHNNWVWCSDTIHDQWYIRGKAPEAAAFIRGFLRPSTYVYVHHTLNHQQVHRAGPEVSRLHPLHPRLPISMNITKHSVALLKLSLVALMILELASSNCGCTQKLLFLFTLFIGYSY